MKTITIYHPHTHEGVAYDPPPDGIALHVNDADAALLEAWGLTTPPARIADASATPTDVALAPRHDRRSRAVLDAPRHDAAAAANTAQETRTV